MKASSDRRASKDRGLCFFQTLILDPDVEIAHASSYQVRQAANALILQCAANSESTGGIASNIGELSSRIVDVTPDLLDVTVLALMNEQVETISSLLSWASTNPMFNAEVALG